MNYLESLDFFAKVCIIFLRIIFFLFISAIFTCPHKHLVRLRRFKVPLNLLNL